MTTIAGMRVSEKELKQAIKEVGEVVGSHSRGSAMRGLNVVAGAFACLLEIYANPNAENPQGMCDDPMAFRAIFADLIANGPSITPQKRGNVNAKETAQA